MRWMRVAVVLGVVLKAAVLGTWWWVSTARAERTASAERPAAAEGPVAIPPALLAESRGFRELLEAVKTRGQELDRREQAIAGRESALQTLQKAVAAEVTRLEKLGAGTPARTAGAPAAAAGPATAGPPAAGPPAVTKIYESMKAEEAAPIFDALDDPTATAILGGMKEKQIGAILAAMNRERAVALTKSLAGEREHH